MSFFKVKNKFPEKIIENIFNWRFSLPFIYLVSKAFPFLIISKLQQKKYNYRLSQARVVVEIAFGRLKACWHRLAKKTDVHIDNVPPSLQPVVYYTMCVRSIRKASMKNGYRKLIWISLIVSSAHQYNHQEVGVNKFEQY